QRKNQCRPDPEHECLLAHRKLAIQASLMLRQSRPSACNRDVTTSCRAQSRTRPARHRGLARPGNSADPCRPRTTSEETTMLSRRRLLRTGAATVAAAMIARMPRAFAATYDLMIKGGRVVDPSVGLDAVRDVAIAKGKIAAVDTNIAGDAAETIDAAGKLV